MGKKRQRTPMTDTQLETAMQRLIDIRPVANEYKELCGEIKAELQFRHINAFTSKAGHSANLKPKTTREWIVEELQHVLPRAVFGLLCPRKADTKKLNQRLAAMPEDKALAGCFIDKPGTPELEVLAAGETSVNEVAEEEERAA